MPELSYTYFHDQKHFYLSLVDKIRSDLTELFWVKVKKNWKMCHFFAKVHIKVVHSHHEVIPK